MTLIEAITIENPCTHSWKQMSEANNGRYCIHCCKTVVDFTTMSNEEIFKYLSNQDRVCGRFGTQQLNSLNQNLSYSKIGVLSWKGWGLAALILGFSQYVKADIKPVIGVEQSPFVNSYKPVVDSSKIVRGRIIDQEDGTPIPGVSVMLKGTDKETVTDVNGRFKIEVDSNADILIAKLIGYQNKEILAGNLPTSNIDVALQEKHSYYAATLGMVSVVKKPLHTSIWHKLRSAVRSVFH